MSGMGNRFVKAGYQTPKPLIEMDGIPIIEHVVKMFPSEEDFPLDEPPFVLFLISDPTLSIA